MTGGNLLCRQRGQEPDGVEDLNQWLRHRVRTAANQRVWETTQKRVMVRWEAEQKSPHPVAARAAVANLDNEMRKVARDAFVS